MIPQKLRFGGMQNPLDRNLDIFMGMDIFLAHWFTSVFQKCTECMQDKWPNGCIVVSQKNKHVRVLFDGTPEVIPSIFYVITHYRLAFIFWVLWYFVYACVMTIASMVRKTRSLVRVRVSSRNDCKATTLASILDAGQLVFWSSSKWQLIES